MYEAWSLEFTWKNNMEKYFLTIAENNDSLLECRAFWGQEDSSQHTYIMIQPARLPGRKSLHLCNPDITPYESPYWEVEQLVICPCSCSVISSHSGTEYSITIIIQLHTKVFLLYRTVRGKEEWKKNEYHLHYRCFPPHPLAAMCCALTQ